MAEKCYHFEIGDTDMGNAKTFISNSYWDGAYSGLLSADRLIADLHAMEVAYLENDQNELEITRPIDLDEIYGDDESSIFDNLEIGKECPFEIKTEYLTKKFGFTFCRIKNVKLQIVVPNFSGTYIDAELTLENNVLKINGHTDLQNRIGVVKVATSTANYISGMLDFNFETEKYSPFEGAGLDSKWKLKIFENDKLNKEDISKIIIFISYTARRG